MSVEIRGMTMDDYEDVIALWHSDAGVGLSDADSLGMYLTFGPRRGRVDSERNCISNIHAAGMSAEDAAARATNLIKSMLKHHASGVALAARTPRLSGAEHVRDKPP